jgi:hypothetical protein
MSARSTTISYQRPPFIYGQILARSAHEAAMNSKIPGIGRFLTQGMAAGAFVCFVLMVVHVLYYSVGGYRFLIGLLLPFALASGMALGMVQGLIIWACTRLARHNLDKGSRAAIGVLVVAILTGILLLMPSPSREVGVEYYLAFGAVNILSGVTYGLFTGSRLQPWAALVRGAEWLPRHSRWLTGLTGFVLRVVIIFSLMESILYLILILQSDSQNDLLLFVIACGHFLAASLIVFARLKYWPLVSLALIINFPVVVFITDVLTHAEPFWWYAGVSYLGLWAAFLLTRWSRFYPALSFINEEIHYYLID